MNSNDCRISTTGRTRTCLDRSQLVRNSPQQTLQAILSNQKYNKKRELPDTPFEINESSNIKRRPSEVSLSSLGTSVIDLQIDERNVNVIIFGQDDVESLKRNTDASCICGICTYLLYLINRI